MNSDVDAVALLLLLNFKTLSLFLNTMRCLFIVYTMMTCRRHQQQAAIE